ncbi:MAG: PSD1 and planctomycete cytochrome C domain-containing protein, partial [Ferruginibacter sp.]
LIKKQEVELNIQVRAILAHNCYKCHGPEKVKGELRLDRKDMVFKGGEHGLILMPGNPAESEMVKRITLPAGDKKAMPSKEKRLSAAEIDIIKLWIQKGAPWPANSDKDVLFQVAQLQPRNPPLPPASANLQNPVDLWVNEYFKKNKISWSQPVDDKTYLRRVYLDIIGLLPSAKEAELFIADNSPGKRASLVRQLLNREDDYAGHWLSFWNDALRNDYTGTGYITGGRFNITDWLYKSLRSNEPYDQFVQELLSPAKQSKGFIEGIKWRGVINASQKTEMQAAQNVSQVFLGLNLKCASCHNSFVSNWKLTDAYAFANIFADSSLEINRCDKPTGKYTAAAMPWKELGTIDSGAKTAVKRKQLSENITKPANGRFYRTIVNRIWAQLMGRGLVEPVDLMDNAPWSQDLLDWMAFNFVEGKCDIKELIYLLATSNTYQLPSVGFKDPNSIIAPDFKFSGMLRKRMSAEQFADAVSAVIQPVFADSLMGYNPYEKKSTEISKPPFARASLVINNPFLIALGRPSRETVSTSRESQANLLQALELTKGERFNNTLKKGAENWQKQYRTSDAIIKELYARALFRTPNQKEFELAKKALGDHPDKEAIQDLFWAIVLLPEFQIIY